MDNLPKLPEKHRMVQVYKATGGDRSYDEDDYRPYYTADQMLAFQRETVEACAKVAEEYEEGSGGHIAIRSMK